MEVASRNTNPAEAYSRRLVLHLPVSISDELFQSVSGEQVATKRVYNGQCILEGEARHSHAGIALFAA